MVQTISSQKSEQIRDGEEAKDLILDIQFDAFGKRFATASSDQKIRIYKRCDNGKYKLETSWQAHSATIWHLDWAHPHHGIILASCSFDKYLRTWMPPVQKNTDFNKRGHSNHNRDYAQEWEMTGDDCVDRRASVTDVSRAWTQLTTKLDIDWRGPVNIVRFAPNAGKHHVLAVGAKDVHVIHITQTVDKTPSKFKFEPQRMISDQLNKINLEKCWRLAWDSIGSSLYTTHGSKTMLCWTRQYTNDKESWNAKTVENQP